MPVQRATTAATSSSSTSSFTIEPRLLRVALLELLLERRQLAVADLGDALEVALALRPLGLHPQRIDLLRDLADAVERLLLARPARGEPVAPLLRLGELGLERRPDLVRLAAQRGELDLELRHAPVRLVELDRRRLDLHLQPGSGLVDEVDRLVGQLPVGDVALGEDGRGDERRVADPHLVVRLVALLQAAQDRDRVGDGRLADEDGLEAPLERGVLLDVLAVLVERRRADAAELAAREHRLEHVRGVDGALGRARADDRVQLVDEDDDLAGGVRDLLEHGLEPLLELAAVLRAGEQAADVERPDALPLQRLGDVAGDDSLREPLDDRGLADAGLADQDGVVLRAAREHLDDAADLLVAADDRVELPALRGLGQVAAELRERLVGALGIGGGDAAAGRDLGDLREQLVARDDVEREQEVLRRDVLVLQLLRLVEGAVEHLRELRADLRLLLRALDARLLGERRLGLRAQRVGVGHELARQLLVEQREQQMLGIELGVAVPARELLRCRDGLLGLDRELVEVHALLPFRVAARRARARGRGGTAGARPAPRGAAAAADARSARAPCAARPRAAARARRRRD